MQTSVAIQRNYRKLSSQIKYICTLKPSNCAPGYRYPKEILTSAHKETFLRLSPGLLFVIVRWGTIPWRADRQNVVDTYHRAAQCYKYRAQQKMQETKWKGYHDAIYSNSIFSAYIFINIWKCFPWGEESKENLKQGMGIKGKF